MTYARLEGDARLPGHISWGIGAVTIGVRISPRSQRRQAYTLRTCRTILTCGGMITISFRVSVLIL